MKNVRRRVWITGLGMITPIGIGLDAVRRIHEFSIHATGQRGFCEPGSDRRSDFRHRHRVIV